MWEETILLGLEVRSVTIDNGLPGAKREEADGFIHGHWSRSMA